VKRLDQGHLHPKLEVLGLTCPGRASPVGGEHSRKEPFEQLVNSYLEHSDMSTWLVENARDMAPPKCTCYTNIHEHTWTALKCRPNSTCKASAKHLPAAKTSALASPCIHSQTGQITSGSPLWRHGKSRRCSEDIYLILTLQAKQQDLSDMMYTYL
jgi:hypothetical protein